MFWSNKGRINLKLKKVSNLIKYIKKSNEIIKISKIKFFYIFKKKKYKKKIFAMNELM